MRFINLLTIVSLILMENFGGCRGYKSLIMFEVLLKRVAEAVLSGLENGVSGGEIDHLRHLLTK